MAQISNSKQMKPGIAKKKAKDIVATLDEAAMLQQLRKQFAKHAAKKEEHKQLVERRISHLKAQHAEHCHKENALRWIQATPATQKLMTESRKEKEKLASEMAKLQHELDTTSVLAYVRELDTYFQKQKQSLRDERSQLVQQAKRQAKQRIQEFRLVSNAKALHPQDWKPSVSRNSTLNQTPNHFEPNPGGKPFDFGDRSLWPIQPPRTGAGRNRSLHAKPWRAVPGGRLFGAPPLDGLSREQQEKIRVKEKEHMRLKLQKQDGNTDKRTNQKSCEIRQPWKAAASAPGQLFQKCKPDRPLTYLERLRALMMTTPDRNRFDYRKHGKQAWLPTRNGELFSSTKKDNQVQQFLGESW